MKQAITIESIKIEHPIDENPDTSYMGEYTDRETDTTIKRENVDRREFKYFEPANPEYGQQDYERMHGITQ